MCPKDESIRSKSRTVLELPLCLELANTPRPWGRLTGATVVAMSTGLDELRKPKHKQLLSASSGQHRELCEVVGLSSEAWEGEVDG